MGENIDAIAQAACGATSAGKLFPWAELSEVHRDQWREVADAVLAALDPLYEQKLKKIKDLAEEGIRFAENECHWPTGEVMSGAENALFEILEELAQ